MTLLDDIRRELRFYALPLGVAALLAACGVVLMLAGCQVAQHPSKPIEDAQKQSAASYSKVARHADDGLADNGRTAKAIDSGNLPEAKDGNRKQAASFRAIKDEAGTGGKSVSDALEAAAKERARAISEAAAKDREIAALKSEGLRKTRLLLASVGGLSLITGVGLIAVAFAFGVRSMPFAFVALGTGAGCLVAMRALDFIDWALWGVAGVAAVALVWAAIHAKAGIQTIATVEELKRVGAVTDLALQDAGAKTQRFVTKAVVNARTNGGWFHEVADWFKSAWARVFGRKAA